MNRIIFKYQLNSAVNHLPQGAKILSAQVQNDQICIWALVDPDRPLVMRKLKIFGTGQPLPVHGPIEAVFVGTVQQGIYVWHIFDFGE